jgi:DHA2 family multidrug resistance protein-like MFS transporter
MAIGLKTLPRTPRASHAFDFPGALLAASCLGLFMLGIGSAAHHERPAYIAIELIAAIGLGWVLIRRQADHPAPILPIDLFRRPLFTLSRASPSSRCRSISRTFSAAPRSRLASS